MADWLAIFTNIAWRLYIVYLLCQANVTSAVKSNIFCRKMQHNSLRAILSEYTCTERARWKKNVFIKWIFSLYSHYYSLKKINGTVPARSRVSRRFHDWINGHNPIRVTTPFFTKTTKFHAIIALNTLVFTVVLVYTELIYEWRWEMLVRRYRTVPLTIFFKNTIADNIFDLGSHSQTAVPLSISSVPRTYF